MQLKIDGEVADLDSFPDTCPICHHGIQPKPKIAFHASELIDYLMQCPRETCSHGFIARYVLDTPGSHYRYTHSVPISSYCCA